MNSSIELGDRANDARRSWGLVSALQSLSTALIRAGADALDQEMVLRSVREVCACARREHLPPERLIVELKHVFAEAIPRARIPYDKHEVIGSGLVQYAIESYFKNLE